MTPRLRSTAIATLAGREVEPHVSLDDRAGNVITTVALFVVAATIFYVSRGAFFILLLSLLFAYLLDPAVTSVQHHAPLGPKNRAWAIAQVYLVGTVVISNVVYRFGPHLAAQIKNLNSVVPKIIAGVGLPFPLEASVALGFQRRCVPELRSPYALIQAVGALESRCSGPS